MKLKIVFYMLSAFFVIVLNACSESSDSAPGLLKAEPAPNSTLQQSPQSLRLHYEFAPDPQHSDITLRGPQGDIPLMGLHTMGADDLMIMINHPPLQRGEYTVTWNAKSVNGNDRSHGDYTFHIQPQD